MKKEYILLAIGLLLIIAMLMVPFPEDFVCIKEPCTPPSLASTSVGGILFLTGIILVIVSIILLVKNRKTKKK